jgi:LacI family gluconate utilization system Gnt-I transcriptional repressor
MAEKENPLKFRSAVTLADVAREAQVGESTASRILRNHGSFAEETREAVMAAVARLGYVPNRIARTLASTNSGLIGIVIPSLANIVFPDLLRGASTVLEENGFHSLIGVTEYNPEREEELVESLLAWRPAGLILAGLEHTDRCRTMLKNSGVRVAELLDIDGEGIDIVVGFSHTQAGKAGAEFLMSRGYKRIGYVGHDIVRDHRARKRFTGFLSKLSEHGLSLEDKEIISAPSSIESGRNGLMRMFERTPSLDAVYFSNDDMAIGGYFFCLSRGIKIPDRLALLGYSGLDVGRLAPQPLSTIRTPRALAGRLGAKLVCSDQPSTVIDLGFELVEGATA